VFYTTDDQKNTLAPNKTPLLLGTHEYTWVRTTHEVWPVITP